MCLVFYSFVGGADTSGSIDLDYMVEKLGIDKSKIDDLSNLLYKNYGTTMAGLRVLFHLLSFHFLAQNGNSLLNSEISDSLCLFCFIVNSGNWIWLWIWWISQVHAFFFLLLLSPFVSSDEIDFWTLAITVMFMGDYLMRIWNQTQFWGTFCWACPIGNW